MCCLRIQSLPFPGGIFLFVQRSSALDLRCIVMKRIFLFLISLACIAAGKTQTLGGNAVFSFLQQPNCALQSALGGINVSAITNDVGMAFQNPALLRDGMDKQLGTSYNAFLAGIRNYSATHAWHLANAHTNLAIGANFFDYGAIPQTDAAGNILGSFRPVDYVVQAMASRTYHERFRYGMTMKYIQSAYGQYRASGLAFDVGVAYYDSVNRFQASVVVKHMGTQLATYDGSGRKEELPFDLQAGITQRLEHAPFQFSLTVHHLQRFNIYYNDTSFRAAEGELGYGGATTLQKIFSHIVLSAQVYLHEKLELDFGYNFQRRQDLNAYNLSSGLNGFTMGASVLLNKLHIRYATGVYQKNLFHQLSLNLNWKGRVE